MPNKVHFWVNLDDIPDSLRKDPTYEILLHIKWGDKAGTDDVIGNTYEYGPTNILREVDKGNRLDISTDEKIDDKFVIARAILRKNQVEQNEGKSDIASITIKETEEFGTVIKKRRKYVNISIKETDDKGYTPPTVNLIPPGKDNE